MSEQVIFDHVIRPMFKRSLARLKPETIAQLKGLGLDPTRTLLPAYPARTWAAVTQAMCADLYPDLPLQEGARKLARSTVDDFADELVGRAMFSLLKLIGAERIARRMTQNLRTGANFIEAKLNRVCEAPLTNELWINDVSGLPGFYLGLLEGGMHHTSGDEYRIELVREDGAAAWYHLTYVGPAPRQPR